MLDAARAFVGQQVLVATEVGMLHQLRRAAPDVDFRAVNDRASCRYMKMITPEKLLRALREGRDEVQVDPELAARARRAVQRMIEIGDAGGRGMTVWGAEADLVVVGTGVAGLDRRHRRRGRRGCASSSSPRTRPTPGRRGWAQGGVAVVAR